MWQKEYRVKSHNCVCVIDRGLGEDYPYFVTRVLINPENISVALDTTNFFNISIQDTANYQFSRAMDFMGYDWKY